MPYGDLTTPKLPNETPQNQTGILPIYYGLKPLQPAKEFENLR